MPLYHHLSGFPASFRAPLGHFRVKYGFHALRAAENDRYGDLTPFLPGSINTNRATLIEVETDARYGTTKLVYRVNITEDLDLVMAVCPENHIWKVKTVWGNETTDQHNTINLGRYQQVMASVAS